MSASSYGIGKGEAQVFDTSGLAKQVVYNKEKREKFLLDSMMEMDSTNLWAARDMPGFQSMVDEYRDFVGQNYKSLSNPTKNMDIWLQKGDMESKIKLFVATSASDKSAAVKYSNYLTLSDNNDKWEEIVDENGISELDKFKQGIGQWATPGTSHSNTDFYQRKVNLGTDIEGAVKSALPQIAKKTGNSFDAATQTWTYTTEQTLNPEDWTGVIGAKFDLLVDDQDIASAYERKYKKAFEAGTTTAASARDWFIEQAEPFMPKLDVKEIEKNEKLPSISSILQTDERTFLNTTQIQTGKSELRLTNPITPEIAKNSWATKSDIEKRAFENMGDWIDKDGNTHTGINNADDWFKYWDVKQSQVSLEGTQGAAKSTPRYNYVSSNPSVYESGGYQTVNIENSKGRGMMTVPTIIDESGVEQIDKSLDVLPISYQVQNGVIGVNVKTSSQDSSADYLLIDNEVKQLESNFNSAEKKLKEAGWEKGMDIDDIDDLAKINSGYGIMDDTQLEADIELVTNYETLITEKIEERNKLKSNYTGVGFIPLYNISDGSYTDNHALFGGRATGRAIESLKTGSSEVEEEEENEYGI